MAEEMFGVQRAAHYLEGPRRQVPGLDGLHRMTSQLLAERLPETGHILVLGAGGGLELAMLAEAHAGWRFEGVDPSGPMLALAQETVGAHAARMGFVEGYVGDASEGPFDGAVCLLTFHFIDREQRVDTLRQLRRRLRPGAPLVLAHISLPADPEARATGLNRHITFGAAGPMTPAQLEASRAAMLSRLTILAPEEEEAMLAEAGFSGVTGFYGGFSLRGWVGYAE